MKYFAAIVCCCALLFLGACRPSPEKLLATANKYHQNKKYREASILYQKVIAKDKTNAEAYYREGLNRLDQGDPVNAVKFLRRAVDLKPANTDAEAKLAQIYLSAYISNPKRFKTLMPEIVDLKAKILQQDPNSFEGLRLQGLLDLVDHNADQAIQTFAKANQVKPYSRDLVGWYAEALANAGHPDQAESLVRDMLAHDKTWGSGYDFLVALKAKTNDKAAVQGILRERVQNDPKNATAIANLANFLLTTGQYNDAESTMKRVLQDKAAFPMGREMMGDFYSRAQKYDQAVQQYQIGGQEDPKNDLKYQQRIVVMYQRMGKHDDALRLAKSLASKNSKDTLSNEMYASLLLDSGLHSDVSKSLAELKTLVQNNPSNAVLHLDLARAYFATNDTSKAISEDLEALQGETKSQTPRPNVVIPARVLAATIYERRGQHAQALEQADQVLKAQENHPEARLLRDQAWIGLNEADQAQPDLEKLVAELPQFNDARLTLGTLYMREKNLAKATDQFEHVWKATPPDARGYLGMQQVKLAQGDAAGAVSAMKDLADKNPTVVSYRYELAGFQTEAGRMANRSNPAQAKQFFQQAADNYKEILKTTANSADVWIRLGLLQEALGQNDPALASFEQASSADPHNAQAPIERANLLENLGRNKEASDLYNRVLGMDPNNAIALNNLAFLNAESDTNLDQAMTYAERAKKEAPNSPDISDTLGYVYYRKNLNSAALQIFKQNVQDQPQNATFHLHLAMALLKQGDKQGARQEADKALKTAQPAQQDKIKSFVGQIG